MKKGNRNLCNMGLSEVLFPKNKMEAPPKMKGNRQMSYKRKKEEEETEAVWVTKTIDVLMPVDGFGNYQDIFTYLIKVVDSFDNRYSYIVGLLSTCYMNNGCIKKTQEKLANDLISFFKSKGYFDLERDAK